jgi:hypothetical protein
MVGWIIEFLNPIIGRLERTRALSGGVFSENKTIICMMRRFHYGRQSLLPVDSVACRFIYGLARAPINSTIRNSARVMTQTHTQLKIKCAQIYMTAPLSLCARAHPFPFAFDPLQITSPAD